MAAQWLAPPGAWATPTSASFDGSAAAYGTHLVEVIPGAPTADTVLDGGGPTAQAGLSSLGGGSGYAAMPDPGSFIIGAPDLVAGLVPLPASPPAYPLYASADASSPHKSVSAQAYDLRADFSTTAAKGWSAVGAGGPASVGRVESQASVSVKANGTVVATATSQGTGLSLGPVSIGHLTSTATRTLAPDGTIRSLSSMKITGLRVGSTDVPLSAGGPFESAANTVLQPLGMRLQLQKEQRTADTVVAPMLTLTGGLPLNGLPVSPGTGDGRYRLSLGEATARLVASPPSPGVAGPLVQVSTPQAVPDGKDAGVSQAVPPMIGSDAGAFGAAPGLAPLSPGPVAGAARLSALRLGSLELMDFYIVLVAGALVAFVTTHLVRTLGVKAPWSSTAG